MIANSEEPEQGLMFLAQGHNAMTPVRLKPAISSLPGKASRALVDIARLVDNSKYVLEAW